MNLNVFVSKTKHAIMELRARVPRLTIVVSATLLVQIIIVFAVLVIIYRLIGEANRTQDWAVDPVQASQEFRPGQAVTVNLDTVTVYVPPFAIPLPGSIHITARESDLYPVAGQSEWIRPQVVDVQFRNARGTPVSGIALAAPIRICFKLTQTQWQDFSRHPESYAVQYHGSDKNQPLWLDLLTTKDSDQFELCGRTDHLSIFALAIKSKVSIPVTGPTTIPTTATPPPTPIPTRPSFSSIEPGENNRERESAAAAQLISTFAPTNASPPTSTQQAGATNSAPTATRPPPTATRPAPTATSPAPTATRPAPTATSPAPTATRPAPTATQVPPTAIPPTTIPPTVVPPTTEPPATEPPATEPPATEPPATEPPATEPPATEPPATEPPATEPPATEPPPLPASALSLPTDLLTIVLGH